MPDSRSPKTETTTIGMLVPNQISAMLAYWDRNLVCRFANDSYSEWFGKTKEEIIDLMTIKELLGPLYQLNLPHINAALAGQKQVFERDIKLPDGKTRSSLATYYPHIVDDEVRGFFVHVADVSYLKEINSRLLKSRQDMLRNVIEAQEKERSSIAYILRDNINQTLSYCSILLQQAMAKKECHDLMADPLRSIHQVINELNTLTLNLAPTAIEQFGFIAGIEDYVENYMKKQSAKVTFSHIEKNIEQLNLSDKLSVFRIIQNFLLILSHNPMAKDIEINVQYTEPGLTLKLSCNDGNIDMKKEGNEFRDIRHRVEYYGGTIEEIQTEKEMTLLINLTIT